MRLEKDDPGRPPQLGGLVMGDLEQRLMAAMHAVEVADGEGRAARRGRYLVRAVEDLHGGDASPIEAGWSRVARGGQTPRRSVCEKSRLCAEGADPRYAAFIAAGRAGTISTASPSRTALP